MDGWGLALAVLWLETLQVTCKIFCGPCFALSFSAFFSGVIRSFVPPASSAPLSAIADAMGP